MNSIGLRAARATRLTQVRGFSTSPIARHGPSGPYSNLPFKVHGRKYVPYWVLHFSFFAIGLGTPFAIAYYQLKKSGTI